MAGIHCTNQLLYSAPALVFSKEKQGAGTQAADTQEKKKKKLTINTDEENVTNGSKVFTQIAETLYNRKKYREALLVSDTAIELDETNKRSYITRAAAFIRLGRYREGLRELRRVDKPNDCNVVKLKTLASWYSGEFEESAVAASRAYRIRTQPPLFKDMFNTAIGSIERCIGPSAGDILLESFDVISQMEDEKRKKAESAGGTTQYCDATLSQSDNRKSTVALINQAHRCEAYKKEFFLYLMQLHMGRLAVSNRFLSQLSKMPGFVAPNQKGVDRMDLLINCAIKDLVRRMEELMTDMPLYVYHKMAAIKKSARVQEHDRQRHEEMMAQTKKHIERMIVKMIAVRDKNVPMESIRAGHRARNVITSLPKSLLPEKRMYLKIVHHLLGVVLLEAKLKDPNLTDAANKSHLLGWLGIKAQDVIMKNSPFPFFDQARWLPWAMHAYSLSPSHLERCWLLYIIAVCNAGYGNYDGCRNHIRRSVNEARATGSHIWAINGLVFQAHAELKLNGKLDAKNSIKEAIELAQELKDETILASLIVMSEAIDEKILDSDQVDEERRFNRSLVAMMPTNAMKNEMRHVLHHRAFIPKQRRLPITVRRDSPPNLGDTAEDADRQKKPRLWPPVKKSL